MEEEEEEEEEAPLDALRLFKGESLVHCLPKTPTATINSQSCPCITPQTKNTGGDDVDAALTNETDRKLQSSIERATRWMLENHPDLVSLTVPYLNFLYTVKHKLFASQIKAVDGSVPATLGTVASSRVEGSHHTFKKHHKK